MSTKTEHLISVNKAVDLPFTGNLDISISTPSKRPSASETNKTPITVYISSEGSSNPIGCYIYSIPSRSNEIYSTILNNANESLLDLTKKVSTLISKRYKSPSYININGSFGVEEFTPIIGCIINEIETVYKE